MMNEDIIMSQKPYLIRAMYEWMLDNSYTPRLIVSPLVKGSKLPSFLSQQTQITLDISPAAVTGISLGNSELGFETFFDKSSFHVLLSINSVAAIISKEKEVGYVFDIEDFLPRGINLDNTNTNPSSNTESEVKESPKSKRKITKKTVIDKTTSSKLKKKPLKKKKSSKGFFSTLKSIIKK